MQENQEKERAALVFEPIDRCAALSKAQPGHVGVASRPASLHGPHANGLLPTTGSLFEHWADTSTPVEHTATSPKKHPAVIQSHRPAEKKKAEMTGIGSSVSLNRFVTAAKQVEARWEGLTAKQRADTLSKAANDELKAVGVPTVDDALVDLGVTLGQFDAEAWKLDLGEKAFSEPHVTPKQAADIADTVYHEARHAEQDYRVAQLLCMQEKSIEQTYKLTKTNMRVLQHAFAKTKPLTKTESKEAQSFFESIHGGGSQHNDQLRKNVDARTAIRENAERGYKIIRTKTDVSAAEKDGAMAALQKAQEKENEATAQYMLLPEEADAYKIGNAVTNAYLFGK